MELRGIDAPSATALWKVELPSSEAQPFPAFAPQGDRLYVALDSAVYSLSWATGDMQQLYSSPGAVSDIAVDTAGANIALAIAPKAGCRPFAGNCDGMANGGIVVLDSSSGTERRRLVAGEPPLSASVRGIPFHLSWVGEDRLAVETTNLDALGGDPVIVVDLDAATVDSLSIQSPALFAPDRRYIVGRPSGDSPRCQLESRLAVIRPDGSTVKMLQQDDRDLQAIAWSPDGTELLFQSTLWLPPSRPTACPDVPEIQEQYVVDGQGNVTSVGDLGMLMNRWYGDKVVSWQCDGESWSSTRKAVRSFVCASSEGSLSLGAMEIASGQQVWVLTD